MPGNAKELLEAASKAAEAEEKDYIRIGTGTCGQAAGAEAVYDTFSDEVRRRHLPVQVQKCGCIGMCYAEPLVEVKGGGLPVVRYGKVTPEIALRIVQRHLVDKVLLNDYIYDLQYKE